MNEPWPPLAGEQASERRADESGRLVEKRSFDSSVDKRWLLEHADGGETPFPSDRSIQCLYEEQAERTPDAVAVVFGASSLTYGELNYRSNAVALRLRELGVDRETRVAICIDRSLDMIVGLLGILKSGGAYVPLDPDFPVQRLQLMLGDAQASVLLSTVRRASLFSDYKGKLVVLDSAVRDGPHGSEAANPTGNLPDRNQPEDLAYITYTSGSTGQPKGISIVHRAVVRLVKSTKYADFGAQHVFLHLSPLAFDASTFEIWGPLLNGARLVVAPPGILSLAELGDCIRRHRVTTIFLTTGLFHQVVEFQLRDLGSLRQLLTGGDVLSPVHVQKAIDSLPACRVIPCYGPTENTTFTTCHELDRSCAVGDRVPIGRPIANTRVYVLDDKLKLVPIGAEGELCVGGDGLARDYWRQPELTQQKFVNVEIEPGHTMRLYRTGDRVRWHADGYLEFLGRMDQQVKIRGFRIEPGEIEHVLGQHLGVADVTVQPREAPGGKRLAAYVVSRAGHALTSAMLREFLAPQLPSYMVPAEFTFLAELPLTVNGKVDRRALATLAPSEADPGRFDLPRTPTERKLSELWRHVLGLEQVGIHQTFLEVGGDSLRAMQLASRIGDWFHVELSIADFLRGGTIAHQGVSIEQRQPARQFADGQSPEFAGDQSPRSSPQIGAGEQDAPLSYAQQRLWFLHECDPENRAYDVYLAYRLRGRLDVDLLERCLQQIVERHAVLRTTFIRVGGTVVQRIASSACFRLKRLELRSVPIAERDERLQKLLDAEAREPLDIEHGPVMRMAVVALDGDEHALLLGAHHMAFDGWSEGVLFRELGALYAAGADGRSSPLAPLAFQFADFAAWQRKQPESSRNAELRSYWKTRLQGAPPLLHLPTDFPRPARPSFRGSTLYFDVPASLSQAVHELSRRHQTTLFVTLLGAWKMLLQRYAAQDDLVVGTAVAHRLRTDVEPLIGFFANIAPLRTDMSGDPSFAELTLRVQEVVHGALAHQELPFAEIVREAGVAGDASYAPIAQVMFVLHTVPVSLPRMAVRRMPVDPGTAKFDLTMYAVDQTDGLSLWFEYNADLFADATIRTMAADFQRLLAAIVADPDRSIGELSASIRARPAVSPRSAAGQTRPSASQSVAPDDEAQKKIVAMWSDLLGIENIRPTDDFFALGGHSLLALALVARLENEFDTRVPIAQIFRCRTVAEQAQLVRAPSDAHTMPSLVTVRPGSSHSLVLIPNIGGRAFSCETLWRHFPEDLQLMAIDLEVGGRVLAARTIEELAAQCVDQLKRSPELQPYQLLGYSFGGVLAYEVARQLDALRLPVGLVGIIDTGPVVSMRTSFVEKIFGVCYFAANLPYWLADRVRRRMVGSILRRKWIQLCHRIRRVVPKVGGPAASSVAEFNDADLPCCLVGCSEDERIIRHLHFRAFKAYVPGPYPGKITLFRARIRPLLRHLTPDIGWQRSRVGHLEIRHVPGDHLSIMAEPHCQELAREIVDALDAAQVRAVAALAADAG